MNRQYLINTYLDYFNNWLTIERWSDFHELSIDDSRIILDLGKKYHEEYLEIIKK